MEIKPTTYEISRDEKAIILSRSHDFLDEIELHLPTEEFIHWRGMKKMCPRQHEDKFFRSLITHNVPTGWICGLCDWENCIYKEQFKTKRRIVIAPLDYLKTKYIESFKPHLLFIDDVTSVGYYLTPLPQIKEYLTSLKNLNIIDDDDLETVLKFPHDTVEKIERHCTWFLKFLKEEGAEAISGTVAKRLFTINPRELMEWHHVLNKIGFDKIHKGETVRIPYVLKAFELVEDIDQIFLIEAIHDKDLLRRYVELYKAYGGNVDITFISSNIEFEQNHNSVIYRVLSSKYHDRVTYTKVSLKHPEMQKYIKWKNSQLLKYFFGDRLHHITVGLITHKELIYQKDSYNPKLFLPEEVKSKGLHFGNVRGMNKLEDVDILFVIGSYLISPDGLVKEYVDTFHVEPTDTLHHVRGRGYVTTDKDLQRWVDRRVKYEEWYQTIHRARPARRAVPIVIHGLVPDLIKNEGFKVNNIVVLKGDMGILVYEKTIDEFIVSTVKERHWIYKNDLAELIRQHYPMVGATNQALYRRIGDAIDEHEKLVVMRKAHNKHAIVWQELV